MVALVFLCLLVFFPVKPVVAGQDILIFPEINVVHRSKSAKKSDLKRDDIDHSIDLFYTRTEGKWRFLGEFFLTEGESELERLQIGWSSQAGNTLWLGRFHNPLGYWNTQYHHGTYLQTSISRPGIHEFEDEGGPLASHFSGLLLERLRPISDGGVRIAVAVAAGPQIEESLEPVNILSPGSGSHKLSTTLRFSYSPDLTTSNEVGVFVSYTQIPGNRSSIIEVKQNITGIYGNWQWNKWRLIGELFFVENRLKLPTGNQADSFTNAYLQMEYTGGKKWTHYGRIENTFNARNDAYLTRFPDFIEQRTLLGTRYDITKHHSLKIELSDVHLQRNQYKQFIFQWSAVFP